VSEEEDGEDPLNTFVLSPDNEQIISNHKSGLFKLWQWRGVLFLFSVTFSSFSQVFCCDFSYFFILKQSYSCYIII
jgi:hypothetical protein